jgi:hypothetical protein
VSYVLPILGILALSSLVFVPLVIAGLVEKRKVWTYDTEYRFGDFTLAPAASRYLQINVERAEDAGFEYLARLFDARGKKYQFVYDFVISPDRLTLAYITAGVLGQFPVKGMWLLSKTADQRVFLTVTAQSAVEYDVTGLWRDQLVPTGDFRRALARHLEMLQALPVQLERFSPGAVFDDLHRLHATQCDYMQRGGYIRFLGDDNQDWRYTLRGATKLAVMQFTIGLVRWPYTLIRSLVKR